MISVLDEVFKFFGLILIIMFFSMIISVIAIYIKERKHK